MNKALGWIVIIIIVGGLIWLFSSDLLKPTDTETEIVPLTFINHIQAGFPEQDVFVQNASGTEQVFRVEPEMATSSETLAKMLWSTRDEVEHDPFKLGDEPTGPFRRGTELGFTLAEWLEADGSGTYTVSGEGARIEFTARNLVSNATYTVWCSRITVEPMAVEDMPCGMSDGSENTLTTDADGSASFNLVLSEALPESTENKITLIALAYHSDGETHGEEPGEFGKSTHVHLFSALPVPEVENAVQAETAGAATTSEGDDSVEVDAKL